MERRSLGSTTTTSATEVKRCVMAKLLLYSFGNTFFLVERAGWAVKWRVFSRLGHSASSRCFADRREISRPCPMPAGHWPSPNWKPSNNTLRSCTALEMRMLISASHFSVIQEWSSFFQFFLYKLFSFFSSSSFPFFPSSSSPFELFFLLLICFHLFFRSQNHFVQWFSFKTTYKAF